MGLPMMPRPINPIFIVYLSFVISVRQSAEMPRSSPGPSTGWWLFKAAAFCRTAAYRLACFALRACFCSFLGAALHHLVVQSFKTFVPAGAELFQFTNTVLARLSL